MLNLITIKKRAAEGGHYSTWLHVPELIAEVEKLTLALDKIRDPRKRDHAEPDAYTTLGCVMNIADEALND